MSGACGSEPRCTTPAAAPLEWIKVMLTKAIPSAFLYLLPSIHWKQMSCADHVDGQAIVESTWESLMRSVTHTTSCALSSATPASVRSSLTGHGNNQCI